MGFRNRDRDNKANADRFAKILKALFPLLLNIVFVGVLLLLFIPAEKTDDFTEKAILSGAYSSTVTAHLLYSNYLLGCFLKILQTIIPKVAWFEMMQFIMLFISFTIISYIIWKSDEGQEEQEEGKPAVFRKLLILLPILIYFGYDAYIKLTFTKTAGIALAAGFLLLLTEIRKTKPKILLLVVAYVVLLVGSLIRYEIFKSVIVMFLGILIYEIALIIKRKDHVKKNILKMAGYVAAAVVMIVVVKKVGSYLFVQDPEWRLYKEYNPYKVELQDYGWPDYKEYQAQYEELGISYNDYIMWNTNRNYGDTDIYTLDLMKQICSFKDKESFAEKYIYSVKDFFKTYPVKFFQISGFIVLLCMIVVLIFSDAPYKPALIAFSLLVPLALEYYLYCNGRYAKTHVDYVIMFSACLFISYFLMSAHINKREMLAVFLAGMSIFLINKDYTYIASVNYYGGSFSISQGSARKVIDTISADKANLYIIPNSEYTGLLRAFGTFEPIEKGSLDNLFILSSFMYPSHNAVLKNHGIDNIYKHLCDGNVYYVTTEGDANANVTLTYIQEHYKPDAVYEVVNTIDKAKVYKFH